MSGLPDPVSVEAARTLPWPYDTVHRCLAQAAELGVPPEEAVRALHVVANAGIVRLWDGYLKKWQLLIKATGRPVL